jgi:DNA-directed RNA polymerase subunit E'
MDDYINYDAKIPGFVGKKTGKKLIGEDTVLARIVTISMKGHTPSSKIGLTMRQPFLGKPEWEKIDEKATKEKDTKGGKKGRGPPEKEKPAKVEKEKGAEKE